MAQNEAITSETPSTFWNSTFLVLFGIGILAYKLGGPMVRGWLVVQPAIDRATELETRGGEQMALPILLDQVAGSAQNPRLLWALGDIYTKMDRPLLAHFYFRALSHIDSSSLDPAWRDFALRWQAGDTEDRQELKRELGEAAEVYRKQRVKIPLVYPESINAILNQPATTLSMPFGYFPADHPICISKTRDGLKCGYGFQFGTANLWTAIASQKLAINYTWAGPDCCSVSLADPDLRSLPAVEEEFRARLAKSGQLYSSRQEIERELMAFRVRVLAKHAYALGFLDNASFEKPEEAWTIWNAVALFGWIVAIFVLREATKAFFARSRAGRQPESLPATVKQAPQVQPTEAQMATGAVRRAPVWKRIRYSVLALTMLLAGIGYLTQSAEKVVLPGPSGTLPQRMTIQGSASAIERASNGINFAAGLSLILAAMLSLNIGWRYSSAEAGPVDRILGALSGSGYGVRRWRILAAIIAVGILAWWANFLFAHTVIHWSAGEAATAFQAEVDQLTVHVSGDYIYGVSPDGGTMHVTSFQPATVRAFERAHVRVGVAKQRFELPVPGLLLILILVVLSAWATLRWKRRRANPNGKPDLWTARAFLAVSLLQVYLVLWLSSAEKGVMIFGNSLDPDWLGPAFFFLIAQLAFVASVYYRLRGDKLPSGQRWGWVAIYFLTGLSMLFWIYAFSDASSRTPGLLWLLTYSALMAMFWWLAMARRSSPGAKS